MMFLERGGFAIVAVLSCLALFWQLDSGSLRDWDEAIYAQVAKEMAESGDWLTPHYEYRPFYEKPPLRFWLTAISYRLFGVSELTAHLAAALGGVRIVWCDKMFNNEHLPLSIQHLPFGCGHRPHQGIIKPQARPAGLKGG